MNRNETKITVKVKFIIAVEPILGFWYLHSKKGKESLSCSFSREKKAREINCCLFIHHAEMLIVKEFSSVGPRMKKIKHIAAYQKPEQ